MTSDSELRYCNCGDPENCREVIPGFACKAGNTVDSIRAMTPDERPVLCGKRAPQSAETCELPKDHPGEHFAFGGAQLKARWADERPVLSLEQELVKGLEEIIQWGALNLLPIQHAATLSEACAALAAKDAAHRACPCLHTTPCHPDCTCVVPVSSRGCQRCCSYGSSEQQLAMAEKLAAKDATLARVQRNLESADARFKGEHESRKGAQQLLKQAEAEVASLRAQLAEARALLAACDPPHNLTRNVCACGSVSGMRHARACPVWQAEASTPGAPR